MNMMSGTYPGGCGPDITHHRKETGMRETTALVIVLFLLYALIFALWGTDILKELGIR